MIIVSFEFWLRSPTSHLNLFWNILLSMISVRTCGKRRGLRLGRLKLWDIDNDCRATTLTDSLPLSDHNLERWDTFFQPIPLSWRMRHGEALKKFETLIAAFGQERSDSRYSSRRADKRRVFPSILPPRNPSHSWLFLRE